LVESSTWGSPFYIIGSARRVANMANLDSSAVRPDHARLTSSAYLLGSNREPASKTYEDTDGGRDYGKIGNGRPGQGHAGEHGEHDPSEPLTGMEAVRLGSSFFVFGMLIGKCSMLREECGLTFSVFRSYAIQCSGCCGRRVSIPAEAFCERATNCRSRSALLVIRRQSLLF
jgi:hypothetical protein